MSKDRDRNSNTSPSKLSVTKSNAKSWGDPGKVHSNDASSDDLGRRKASYNEHRTGSAGDGYVYQTRTKGGRASPMQVVDSRPPQKWMGQPKQANEYKKIDNFQYIKSTN